MVRLKNRYLLLDILYPEPTSSSSSWPQEGARATLPGSAGQGITASTTSKPASSLSTTTTAERVGSSSSSRSRQSPQVYIHAPTSDALTPGLLAKLIRDEVSATFGDWGVGRLGGAGAGGVSVKYLSPATSTAIIRCPRASYRFVWTALTYMSCVPELSRSSKSQSANLTRPCVFRVIRVSGTMRKAEEEAIRRARREILRLKELDEDVVLKGLVAASGGDQNLRGPGPSGGSGGAAFDVDVMDEDENGDEDEDEDVDMGGGDED